MICWSLPAGHLTMLITWFPIMRYRSNMFWLAYCVQQHTAFWLSKWTGKLIIVGNSPCHASCMIIMIRNGVIWLLYLTQTSPNAFHHSTLCLVFLENSEAHIRTIPQVRQWTQAEQVSQLISFSITGREAVGCALASQRRKGQLWWWGLAAQSHSWSRRAKPARQMKHNNDLSNPTTAPGKWRKKIGQLVLCVFPFPLRKREKDVIESEGQISKGVKESRMEISDGTNYRIWHYISDSLFIIAMMCPANIIALSVRTRSMKYVINKTTLHYVLSVTSIQNIIKNPLCERMC